MSVQCPDGFSPDSTNALASKPDDSCTLDNDNNTYVRLKYEYERAQGMADVAIGCGQKGTFAMSYGINSSGGVSVTPGGVGGSVSAGEVSEVGVSVEVHSQEFEYVGIPLVLKETREEGTFTKSGGFSGGGFWAKVKFAWEFIWHGPAALIPTMSYNEPDEIKERYLFAAWLICRKPCE